MLQNIQTIIRIAAFIVISNIFIACRYYKPIRVSTATPTEKSAAINQNIEQSKYFILRQPSGNYAIYDLKIDEQLKQVTFKTDRLPYEHIIYTTSKPRQYRMKSRYSPVLNEVHIYASKNVDTTASLSILPFNNIQKIEVIEFDQGRTTLSYVVGITVPVAAAIAIIAISTADLGSVGGGSGGSGDGSSCPYIGVYNGQEYTMQGEIYGGAIFPGLEREDFMLVNAAPVEGIYQFRISNELHEFQHTNFAKLLLVNHKKDIKVLPDQTGRIYTIARPEPATRAILNDRVDITSTLENMDNEVCSFNDTSRTINSVIASFKKPATATEGKLVLHLKSSFWLDKIYERFSQLFGNYYNTWTKNQKQSSGALLNKKLSDQNFPLTISLETEKGWKEVAALNNIGPLAFRELVVPVNVKDAKTQDIKIKLATGFMFWDVDYIGMDYSAEERVTITSLHPFFAEDEKVKDVLPALLYDDQYYLNQPVPGNATILKFRSDERTLPGQTTTVILNTKGYYEHVRDYNGLPKFSSLKQFSKAGYFPLYSMQQYLSEQSINKVVVNK